MPEEDEQVDASTQQQDADLDTANEPDETIEEVKAKLAESEAAKAKAEEIAENQRIRAEKAEGKGKPKPEAKETPKAGELSTKDLYVLIDAKVPQEDVEDVAKFAKFSGISIAEALKSNVVKTILADKVEQRNVANATNIGNTKRGSAKVSDDTLLSKAEKGEFPEDPSALATARFNKLSKK